MGPDDVEIRLRQKESTFMIVWPYEDQFMLSAPAGNFIVEAVHGKKVHASCRIRLRNSLDAKFIRLVIPPKLGSSEALMTLMWQGGLRLTLRISTPNKECTAGQTSETCSGSGWRA